MDCGVRPNEYVTGTTPGHLAIRTGIGEQLSTRALWLYLFALYFVMCLCLLLPGAGELPTYTQLYQSSYIAKAGIRDYMYTGGIQAPGYRGTLRILYGGLRSPLTTRSLLTTKVSTHYQVDRGRLW